MTLFTVGEDVTHRIEDPECPECCEEYPEPCRCGGLMHASEGTEEDPEGNRAIVTCCDRCARSEDQLDEV
ncbi:MAG: hypothetical protein HYR86_15790 [Candidatus Rokubacteria bacterium]|nr:hypothetical protein [Candidatus Rokubacteria bacterium]